MNNYYQAQTSWTYAVAFDPFADQIATSGEIACVQTIGRAKDVFAWQYIARLAFTWYQVLKDLDVVTTFAYNDFPSGTFSSSWVEGASRGSVRLDFTYKNIYKAAIAYEQRYNSKRNSASDRDTLALSLSYTF